MKLTRNREKQQGTEGACLNVLGANVVKKLHRRAALLAVKQTPAGFTSHYFAHTSAHVVHTLRTRYAHMAHTLRTHYAHSLPSNKHLHGTHARTHCADVRRNYSKGCWKSVIGC